MKREPGLYWVHQVSWFPAHWDGKSWSIIGSSREYSTEELASLFYTIGEMVERNKCYSLEDMEKAWRDGRQKYINDNYDDSGTDFIHFITNLQNSKQ